MYYAYAQKLARRAAPHAGRILLLTGMLAAVALAQQAPWQNAATTVDSWFNSTWTIVGGLVVLIAGFQFFMGSGHAKMAAVVEVIIGLALVKYHASIPGIF